MGLEKRVGKLEKKHKAAELTPFKSKELKHAQMIYNICY